MWPRQPPSVPVALSLAGAFPSAASALWCGPGPNRHAQPHLCRWRGPRAVPVPLPSPTGSWGTFGEVQQGALAHLPPVSMAQDQAKGRGRWGDVGATRAPGWQ